MTGHVIQPNPVCCNNCRCFFRRCFDPFQSGQAGAAARAIRSTVTGRETGLLRILVQSEYNPALAARLQSSRNRRWRRLCPEGKPCSMSREPVIHVTMSRARFVCHQAFLSGFFGPYPIQIVQSKDYSCDG